jgi:hypothetical protein
MTSAQPRPLRTLELTTLWDPSSRSAPAKLQQPPSPHAQSMISLPSKAPPALVVSASCSRLYPSTTRIHLCPPAVASGLLVEWSNIGLHYLSNWCTWTSHPRPWLSPFRAFLSQSWLRMRCRCPHGSCRAYRQSRPCSTRHQLQRCSPSGLTNAEDKAALSWPTTPAASSPFRICPGC